MGGKIFDRGGICQIHTGAQRVGGMQGGRIVFAHGIECRIDAAFSHMSKEQRLERAKFCLGRVEIPERVWHLMPSEISIGRTFEIM